MTAPDRFSVPAGRDRGGDGEETAVRLRQVCRAFRIPGAWQGWQEIRIGNINQTYKVDFRQGDPAASGSENGQSYVVQRVNTFVFRDPVAVMDNIDQVTAHIRARNPGQTGLHFFHTQDGRNYLPEQDGFWRICNYIPGRSCNRCEDPAMVRSAGMAFGQFQRMLSDFDASRLHVTIPDFHDTRKRYETLAADAEEDRCGRAGTVREELDWLLSVRDQACLLTDRYHRGELPVRVTHNDTKINNVLFERDSSQAMAVIDLDTVMPGLVGHDFGDAIRSAANNVEEDSPDADGAGVNMDIFEAFAEGFLNPTAAVLTDGEIDTLALSCLALTCEQAVRFLDDYILGDPYFRINYPAHNLVRARCQIGLAKDMIGKLAQMESIVWKWAERCRSSAPAKKPLANQSLSWYDYKL